MPRTLTAARAMVRAGDADTYRAVLRRRAAAARERGARFWVFRSVSEPGAYLEFTETADASAGSRSEAEIALEREMRELAEYGPDAEEVWEEITL